MKTTKNLKFGLHLVVMAAMVIYLSVGSIIPVNAQQLKVDLVGPAPVDNPPLGQSCGLDIGLVIDSSGSIGDNDVTMQQAFNAFVNAFLPSTPTLFSVVEFNTNVVPTTLPFTDNITNITNRIGEADSEWAGWTNWEAGLYEMYQQYDPRATKPDLVIFASDGDPNTIGTDGNSNAGGASESTAVNAAIVQANKIKNDGIHILALGIGEDVNTNNLEKISGTGDVITSNFDTLADDLSNLAKELCGGTITVKKLLDGQPAEGWEFTPNIINGSSNVPSAITDVDGYAQFEIDPIEGNATVDIVETLKNGYDLTSASCDINGDPLGTFDNTNSVDGINIGAFDIVSCTFENTTLPYCGDNEVNQDSEQCDGTDGITGNQTCSDTCSVIEPTPEPITYNGPSLTIVKDVDAATANAGDTLNYTVAVANIGDQTATNVVVDDVLPKGLIYQDGTTTKQWVFDAIAPGQSETINYVAIIEGNAVSNDYTNIASVSATGLTAVEDDATTVVAEKVAAPIVLGEEALPVLSVNKSVSVKVANPGQTITYYVVVTNSGDAIAENAVLIDHIAPGLQFVDTAAPTHTWMLGDILPGNSVTTTYDVIILNDNEPGMYPNTAEVWAVGIDNIYDTAEVEVKTVKVLGAETLPTTGGSAMAFAYLIGAGLVVIFTGLVLKLTVAKK